MLRRTLYVLIMLFAAAAPALAAPEGVTGTFNLQKGGSTDTLTVVQQDDGKFAVVRTKTCFPSGERTVLRGVGHVRRGLLLVDFYETETLPALPGFDPSRGNAAGAPENQLAGDDPAGDDPAGVGDAGGLVGALEADGSNPEGATEPGPATEAKVQVTASVGLGGVNLPEDVQIIQIALGLRGFLDPLTLGVADEDLNEAIRRYQIAMVGYRNPDSRVDTNNKTLAALNGAELPPRAFVVYDSVGQDAANTAEDVETVATALTQAGYLAPGYSGDGADRPLISAIRRYQVEKAGFRVGDGRVDINHRTLAAFNGESFAKVPGAISGPGDLPVGTAFPGDESAAQAPVPTADGALPTGGDELDAFLKTLFPGLPAGESVAAYAFRADRVHGFVSSPTCGQNGRWIQEHGIKVSAQTK